MSEWLCLIGVICYLLGVIGYLQDKAGPVERSFAGSNGAYQWHGCASSAFMSMHVSHVPTCHLSSVTHALTCDTCIVPTCHLPSHHIQNVLGLHVKASVLCRHVQNATHSLSTA